jgi:hypothetical protein
MTKHIQPTPPELFWSGRLLRATNGYWWRGISMNIRLTHIDGKLPNLVLMAISAIHRQRGDEIHFSRDVERGLFEGQYDRVYGSCIFQFSRHRLDRFLLAFPDAIVGGTGVPARDFAGIGITETRATVESVVGEPGGLDYSIYPDFGASLGFTQRGCRLSCRFCVVPQNEGKNRSTKTIAEIWRGPGHSRKLHLLDNDFFGQQGESSIVLADIWNKPRSQAPQRYLLSDSALVSNGMELQQIRYPGDTKLSLSGTIRKGCDMLNGHRQVRESPEWSQVLTIPYMHKPRGHRGIQRNSEAVEWGGQAVTGRLDVCFLASPALMERAFALAKRKQHEFCSFFDCKELICDASHVGERPKLLNVDSNAATESEGK